MGVVGWVRVNRAHPCPVCGRTHYCSVSPAGDLVFCTKEQNDRPSSDGTGWLHAIGGRATNGNGHAAAVPTTRYVLKNDDGAAVAVHCRQDAPDGKRIWWTLPDGTKGLGGRKPTELPLYRSELLAALEVGSTVFVTEGEKAADALASLGVHVVGTVTCADTIPCEEALRDLLPFDVVLWPDNDAKGRSHVGRIGETLLGLHAEPRVVTWPDAPPKGDAADFVAAGLGLEELRALYRAAVRLNPAAPAATPPGVIVRRLADVQTETVLWLWRGRIPFGKLTALDGDPGLGKSTITLDIAARLTRGDLMPDQTMGDRDGPRGVLLLTAEDGVADTIKPRLAALGADQERVFVLEEVPGADGEGQMPAMPRDLAVIEALVVAYDVGLIVVDPLIAFLGDSSETNTWRDQDIRRALGPVAQMCQRTGAALVMVRHLNKGSGGNPIYRGGGSIGIIGAARSGLMVSRDNDDDTGARRVLVPTKQNLSAPSKGLAYHMEQADNGSVKVIWEGETEHTAVGLLAEPLPEDERGALADAVDFLKSELYGDPVLVSEIKRRAREADVSPRTLARARAKLKVVACRVHGPTGPWSLTLPVLPGTKAYEKAQNDA